MEDLEQRRHRLAAMREQASLQTNEVPTPSTPFPDSPLLSNPLDSSEAAPPAADISRSSFDFYTDPLAGFSGSKRRRPGFGILPTPNAVPPLGTAIGPPPPRPPAPPWQAPPFHTQPPAWQPIPYQPPDHIFPGAAHPPVQYYQQGPPLAMIQNSSQSYGRGRDGVLGPGDGGRRSPGRSPSGRVSSGRGYSSSRGGGRGFDATGPGGRNSFGFGRASAAPSGEDGNSSRGGGAHGRGQKWSGLISAREQPHRFFKASMLEDPWRHLEASGGERT